MTQLWEFIADEQNARALSVAISFLAMLGTIAPLIVGAAVYIVRANQNKRQETFNFINNWLSEENLARRRKFIKTLENREQDSTVSELPKEDRLDIADYLNSLEVLAMYVNSGLLREKEVRAFSEGILIGDWKMAETIVAQIREESNDEEYFEHLERLVKRWMQS